MTTLVDLALAYPESSYVRERVSRACEGATWLRAVPAPTEAICQSFGKLAEIEESDQGQITRFRAYATSLEAPTPTTIHRARFPGPSVAVPHISEPDPRIPVTTEFGPPLWTYRGTEASATVAPPSPEAVEDWTVDAAAFALCVAAWRYPRHRAEIAEVIAQRYLHAAEAVGKRPTELHDPLAQVVLICPDTAPKVVRRARKALAERQEPVNVDDPKRLKDSPLRKWKRRRDG